jgi:hypothetical protein
MPSEEPPDDCAGTPVRAPVTAGTRLFRIHRISQHHGASDFNHTVPSSDSGGGRFDTLDAAYGHLYAALSVPGAVAEALLRGERAPTATSRLIPRLQLAGLGLSELELVRPVDLVSLRGADVGQVCQTSWLTKCEPSSYGITRRWGAAIRRWASWGGGFVWRARLDEEQLALVLYSDRIPPGTVVQAGDTLPIDSADGLELVIALLADHNVTVS